MYSNTIFSINNLLDSSDMLYSSMKKSKISQGAFAVLLIALIMPFLVRNSGDNIKLGNNVSVTRLKYDLYTKIDASKKTDLPTGMMLVLSEEALHSINPFSILKSLSHLTPSLFSLLLSKIKLDCCGLYIPEEDITAKIQSDDHFIMFNRFNQDKYNKFLEAKHMTDPMYREYIRQYIAADLLLGTTDDIIESSLNGMSEYIANIYKAFKQRRTVTVRKVKLDVLPHMDITQTDIEKMYVENQHLFKTAVKIKVEVIRSNITKERKMLLGNASRGGNINKMSIDDIAKVLDESVINIDIHGDSTKSDIDIDKHVLDYIRNNVSSGATQQVSYITDNNNITYIYKVVDYKKSEVEGLENVKQTVIEMVTKAKQREYCEKHIDELSFINKKEFTFSLKEVLPKNFLGLSKGSYLEKEFLDIARTAFQFGKDTEHNVKFLISHGNIFLIELDNIEYIADSKEIEKEYAEYFKTLIYQDLLEAFVDKIANI